MGSFSLDMSKFQLKSEKQLSKVVRKTAIGLFSAIMKGTPVDSGRARGAWMFSVNIPDGTAPINIRKYGEAKSEMEAGVKIAPMGSTLWLSNNLSYIETLEMGLYPDPVKFGSRRKKVAKNDPIKYEIKSINGYSYQAVGGFVRLNIMKFQTFLNQSSKGL